MGDEEGDWITVKGVHILIEPGETAGEAFKRTTGREVGSVGKSKSQKTPAPKSTKTPSGSKERLKEHISSFSKKYAKEKVEHLYAYKDGKIVAEKHGKRGSVEFPIKEAKDADIIHNHPNENPAFSPKDIATSIKYNAKSITTITKSRGGWTLNRPENGWPKKSEFIIKWEFDAAVRETKRTDAFKSLSEEVKSKKITAAEGNRRYTDMIAREAMKKLEFEIEENL